MKKQQKEFLQKEFNNIINKYDLHVYIFNYNSTIKNILELKQENAHTKETRKTILNQVLENKPININKYNEAKKPLNDLIETNDKKIELLEIISKSYKVIINNGLKLILNEIIKLYIENVKNTRDKNEFLAIFNEYDFFDEVDVLSDEPKRKRYKYFYHFLISQFHVELNFDRPDISQYNLFNSDIYFNLNHLDINNNFVYENYNNIYDDIKKKNNSLEYEKKINNIFGYKTVEENATKLYNTYKEEMKKQINFIYESNDKIKACNIYNLDGFIKIKPNDFYY